MATKDEVKLQAGGVTQSFKIDEMTLDQLVQLTQGFGHQIEQIREKRAYLRAKIAERIRLMERDGDTSREEGAKRRQAAGAGAVDAAAPGAVIEAKSAAS